jgi:uncharacterized protein
MAPMIWRRIVVPVLSAMMLVVAVPADFGHAQRSPPGEVGQRGQQPPQRRGLLEMLFGPRILQPPPVAQPRVGQPPRAGAQQQPQQQRARPAEPPVQPVEVVEKDPNARTILVVGDFVANGLAWGLEQTFADEPMLTVVEQTSGSSGLVRDDYYDWNGELLNILNERKPDIVVVALGSNDRQQIRVGEERLAPRSEPWEKAYTERVAAMAETLKVYGRPFFWMGAPPMRQNSAMRDMARFNDLYQPPVSAAGGHFVDIWGGFTNEEGRYISSGPDVAGQLRGLRAGDGINFTRAGRLKLAFYVEREIRRQTGIGTGAVDLLASTDQQSQIEIGPDGVKRLVGPVISLSDPLPGASRALVGGPDEEVADATGETETPQYLMIVKGAALPAVSGRADDFTWPPRPRAVNVAQPAAAEAPEADAAN